MIRFSQKVIIILSSIFLLALVSLSLALFTETKIIMDDMADTNTKNLMVTFNQAVLNELEQRLDAIEIVDSLLQYDFDRKALNALLHKDAIERLFTVVGIAYPNGTFITNKADNGGLPASFKPKKQKWYPKAVRSDEIIETQFFSNDIIPKSIMTLSVSLKVNGRYTGMVLWFDTDLSLLGKQTNKFKIYETGYTFVISETAVTLAHKDPQFLTKKASEFMGREIEPKTGKYVSYVNGKKIIITLQKVTGQPWFVGTYIPEEEILASAIDLRNASLAFTVIFIVIMCILTTIMIRYLIKPLDTLNGAMEEATSGDGDLTQRIEAKFDFEFSELAKFFNAFVSRLQTLVQETKGIAILIKKNTDVSADMINKSAEKLSQQQAEVEQLATAMNQMTATAIEVSSNANAAASAAESANQSANDGQSIVNNTVETINQLSKYLDEAVIVVRALHDEVSNIESILKVINDIADQTNLLALNAAIEAARAGETGRGFAVVADEVRILALRTQETTDQISHMIIQLQHSAEEAANTMEESNQVAEDTVQKSVHTTQALDEILNSITSIRDLNQSIASSAQEQTDVAEKINSQTIKIRDLSTEATEQAKRAAQLMQKQVGQVQHQEEMLGKFKV